jgi:hypothetical protein
MNKSPWPNNARKIISAGSTMDDLQRAIEKRKNIDPD